MHQISYCIYKYVEKVEIGEKNNNKLGPID